MKSNVPLEFQVVLYYIIIASIWFLIFNAYITNRSFGDFRAHIQNDLLFVGTTAVLLYFGVHASFKKHQQTQDKLTREKIYREQVFEQLPLVVWTTDLNLTIKSDGGTGLHFLPHIAMGALQSNAQPFLDNFECYRAHEYALSGNDIDCIVQFGGHFFEVQVRPLHTKTGKIIGCIGTAVDLTDNIEMHHDLLDSEARFRSLVSSMEDVIYTLDTQHCYTGVYGRWLENNQLSPDFFLGKTAPEIFNETAAKIHTVSTQRALQGETVVYNWHQTESDETKYYQTRLSPIYDKTGQISGLVGVGRDITDLKLAGQALEEYRMQLESKVEARTYELEQEVSERIRLQKEEHKQRRIAEALRDMALMLTRQLELDAILDHAIQTIKTLIPLDGVTIMLMDDHIVHTVRTIYHNQPAMEQVAGFDPSDIPYLQQLMSTRQATIVHSGNLLDKSNLSSKHQWIQSAIGTPVISNDEVCGFVIAASENPQFFNTQHLETLTFFASHIAAAIQNSRYLQKVQHNAIQDERNRIARELHDAVTQTLFSAGMVAETLLTIAGDDSPKISKGLHNLSHLTKGALAEMRTLLLELRPQKIESLTLEALAKQLSEAFYGRTQIPVQVMADHLPQPLHPDVKLNLYRIIQEALNNIDKHARASHAYIQLRYDGEGLFLCIEDDGTGFDTSQPASGMGLNILRERSQSIKAQIDIDSNIGRGTTICLTVLEENLYD